MKKAILVLPILEKARKSPRLIPVTKTVTRDGKTFPVTYWVLPSDAKAGKVQGGQGDLFDAPPPAAQLDLFDQAPAKDPVARDKQIAEAINAATPENRNQVQDFVLKGDEGTAEPEKTEPETPYEFTPGKVKIGDMLHGVASDEEIDDYSGVIPKKIGLISASKALETERPSWMPAVDDEYFRKQLGRLPFAKIGEDRYLLQIEGDSNRLYGTVSAKARFVLVNLEVLSATNDYYANREKLRVKKAIDADIKKQTENAKAKKADLDKYIEEHGEVRRAVLERNYYVHVLEGKVKSRIKPFRVIGDNKITYTQQALIKAATGNPSDRKAWEVFGEWMREYKQKADDMEIQLEDNQSTFAKGRETSYGNKGTKDDLLGQYGVKVKRQNGDEISPAEIQDIQKSLDALFSVYGDRSSMARKYGLKISHSGDKLMHARRALGIYFPYYKAIGVTAQLGDKHMGFILAHEWAHFMDNYLGGQKYHYASDEPASIANTVADRFRRSMIKPQKSNYQNRTCECFARAFEEYFSIKSGDSEMLQAYRSGDGNYVEPERFKNDIMPLIDQFFAEKGEMLKSMRKVRLWTIG